MLGPQTHLGIGGGMAAQNVTHRGATRAVQEVFDKWQAQGNSTTMVNKTGVQRHAAVQLCSPHRNAVVGRHMDGL